MEVENNSGKQARFVSWHISMRFQDQISDLHCIYFTLIARLVNYLASVSARTALLQKQIHGFPGIFRPHTGFLKVILGDAKTMNHLLHLAFG